MYLVFKTSGQRDDTEIRDTGADLSGEGVRCDIRGVDHDILSY